MQYKAINDDDISSRLGMFLKWDKNIKELSHPINFLQPATLVNSPIVQDELKVVPFLFEDYQSVPRKQLHLKKVRLFKKNT